MAKAASTFETRSRSLKSRVPGPPLVMCTIACTTVLGFAGYRTGAEPSLLSQEVVAAHADAASVTTIAATSVPRSTSSTAEQPELPAGVRIASGKVFVSLPFAARLAHVPQAVVAQLGNALDRNGVLRDTIPTGAEFRLAYAPTDARESTGDYQLLALQIEGRDRWHDSYYFADADGGAFFDRTGRRTGRTEGRLPVHFSRISSRFSEARLHPILNVVRPHYGVDFAAPVGTPVRAVARGRIVKAGWQGGAGRFVKIRHHGGIATGYAHLVRIGPGLRPGARVRRGQIIGYVGASGLATGSHLHFVVYRNGHYVDPLSIRFAGPGALHGRRLRAFRATLSEMDEVMARALRPEPMRTALLVN